MPKRCSTSTKVEPRSWLKRIACSCTCFAYRLIRMNDNWIDNGTFFKGDL
jgi:hypothetical protein